MKELDRAILKSYPPVRVYCDDLESIEAILKSEAENLKVEAEGYQFDSVAEASEYLRDRVIRKLELKAYTPHVSVELDSVQARLYVGASTNAGAGLFHRIDQILRRARRRCWPLYTFPFVWGLIVASNALVAAVLLLAAGVVIPVIALGVAWTVWVGYIRLKRHSTILPGHRGAPGFWTRKKDDVLLAVVSAVVGAILAIGGTLLVQHLVGK